MKNYGLFFLSTGIPTIIVGWWLAYKDAHSTWKLDPVQFILLQFVMMIQHPFQAFAIHFLGLTMGPFLMVCFVCNNKIFNLLDAHVHDKELHHRDEFLRNEKMEFMIFDEQQARQYNAWLKDIACFELNRTAFVERISRMLCRTASYATLVFGIVLAPFGIGLKKANAEQRKGQTFEKVLDPSEAPFVPEPVTVHGAIAFGPTIIVPTNSSETTAITRLRQLDLSVFPRVSKTVSARVVLAFAKFTDGPADPVNVAAIDWQADESLRVSAGRLLNPIGLSRQPPPHKLIELVRADTGITAPFFEQGVVATWTPMSVLSFTAGALSGQGTSTTSDTLSLGLDGQTGSQPNSWRHVTGAHIQYDNGMFFGQTEVVANFDAGQDRPTVGWYTLAVLRPTDLVEPYVRVERVNDLRKQPTHHDSIATAGVNIKPTPNIALRAATTAPITQTPVIGFHFAVQATF